MSPELLNDGRSDYNSPQVRDNSGWINQHERISPQNEEIKEELDIDLEGNRFEQNR